ncbi:beta/alpha barrel domain-containing protein [Roseiflexus castenholzii]|nr:hypothetical protein [Roseiflexus castenholzii]
MEYYDPARTVRYRMAGVQGRRTRRRRVEWGWAWIVLPCAMLNLDALRSESAAIRAQTRKPFNATSAAIRRRWRTLTRGGIAVTFAPYDREFGIDAESVPIGAGRSPLSDEAADLLGEFEPPVVSFHFGPPSAGWLARVEVWGAKIWSLSH